MDFKAIIGLGNPGKKYQNTYHNAGFLAVDYFVKNQADKFKTPNSKVFKYLKKNELIFAKPLTFMNESGKAIREIIKYFDIAAKEVAIVHDDSDLYLGDYKFSFNQGAAGHHGVENVAEALKTKNFCRVRIGIRPSPQTIADSMQTDAEKLHPRKSAINQKVHLSPRLKAGSFVLKKIKPFDKKILETVFSKILDEIK